MSKTRSIDSSAVALTIAGSDPSGGAGLQADLKTFQQLRVFGMSVVTLLTVQNTQAVQQVEVLNPDFVVAQLDAVLHDIHPRAIKTGALGSVDVVRAIGERLKRVDCPLIVDPVLVSKHGYSLVTDDVVEAYKQYLFPLALLVTPNRFEAERLTGLKLDDEQAVREAVHRLKQSGAQHVLIKLGQIEGQSHHVLNSEDKICRIVTPFLASDNTHGTGCILSAAITAKLALGETDIRHAARFGIDRTLEAIRINTQLGHGFHPAETRAMDGSALEP